MNSAESEPLTLEVARTLIAECRGMVASALIAAVDTSPTNSELVAKLLDQLATLRAQRAAILNGNLDAAGEVIRIYGRRPFQRN
jgi:hypothetical protein